MKRVLVVLVASFLVFSVLLAVPAFAGSSGDRFGTGTTEAFSAESVAGQSFFGQFTNSCGNPPATSCMAFDQQGNIEWDQDFGTGPIVFNGTFSELSLGPITLWGATLIDGSPNGEFSISGVTLANLLTFIFISNRDVSCPDGSPLTARGRYRRSNCTPGTRANVSGYASESAIGGSP